MVRTPNAFPLFQYKAISITDAAYTERYNGLYNDPNGEAVYKVKFFMIFSFKKSDYYFSENKPDRGRDKFQIYQIPSSARDCRRYVISSFPFPLLTRFSYFDR